jgi:hypothetical protein
MNDLKGPAVFLAVMIVWHLLTGCAHVKVEHWDGATGNKLSEYSAVGVFRNDITVREDALRLDVNRPGLSDNGLEALHVLPELADEVGHTIQGTQAIDGVLE